MLLKWGYRNLGSFSSYIARDKAASDSRIFALGAVNISALTLNIDGKIQSGVTDAYIRIDSSFRGDKNKSLQDNNGYASSGVSYSADGSMNRFGAITGRFDYATQTIILDPIRLAGGSIADGPDHLGGQRQPDRRQRLCLGAHRQPDHLCAGDALVTGDIDVSTYRRPHRDHRHRAPAPTCTSSTARTRWCTRSGTSSSGDERRRGAAGLGLRQRQRPGQHGRLQRSVEQPGRPADHDLRGRGQPGWVWVYDNGSGGRRPAPAPWWGLGGQLTTTYKPKAR